MGNIERSAVERAARALCDEGIRTLNGKPATWEQHSDGFMAMAERALDAANFRGAVEAGWALNDAIVDHLRANLSLPSAMWTAVEEFQAHAPKRGQ